VEVAVQAVTAAIALAALVVSILVARRQTRTQELVAAIEEARRAEELAARERAQVTASIRREERMRLVVLHNEGPAVARQVGMAVEDLSQAPGLIGLDELPVDLQPHQEMRFIVTVGLGDQQMLQVMVRWADAAGEHEVPYSLLLH